MSAPRSERYPRILARRKTSAPKVVVECIVGLSLLQERGDIIFRLMEGQGLAAQTMGGYHGHDDDNDVDVRVWSRLGIHLVSPPSVYDLCDSGLIGSFGFYELTPANHSNTSRPDSNTATNKALFLDDIRHRRENTYDAGACIGEWDHIPVLLPSPSDGYFRRLHGGSYWVPPYAGGKEMGSALPEYMDPSAALFGYFFWLVTFHDGLRHGVDTNNDGAISVAEFMGYVRRAATGVNIKWLERVLVQAPCLVANGLIHYQHTMHMCNEARLLRERCVGSPSIHACHAENWVRFQALYATGPKYFIEGNESKALYINSSNGQNNSSLRFNTSAIASMCSAAIHTGSEGSP